MFCFVFSLFHLHSLVEDCPQGLRDCRDPALGLEILLKQRSGELRGKEESEVSPGLDAEIRKLGSMCHVSLPLKIKVSSFLQWLPQAGLLLPSAYLEIKSLLSH